MGEIPTVADSDSTATIYGVVGSFLSIVTSHGPVTIN